MNANVATSSRFRRILVGATLALGVGALLLPDSVRTQTPVDADWETPLTSYGHPDLQGNWPNATLTPFERPAGRDAVLGKLKGALDGFDRKMDSRQLDFETPSEDGNAVKTRFTVRYAKQGAPDLVMSGVETAIFDGDRIARLRDDFEQGVEKQLGEWLAKHGSLLGG